MTTKRGPGAKPGKDPGGKATAYARAGVNIAAADSIKHVIARMAETTSRPEVLGGVGFFGGLFELGHYRNPVLVSSTDGVGTKLKIAAALGKYDTIGTDLVNHCVNDIFTSGAEPLFFLDYIAMGKLDPAAIEDIVKGLTAACRESNCTLIGGETAEMPGVYAAGDFDLVGFIIGVIEKDALMYGQTIAAGDAIVGVPSSGLHTNGYSLVRRMFGEDKQALNARYPELGRSLGEELLTPHRCYYSLLKPLLPMIKGLAHITGGGLPGNVPRILPEGLSAHIHRESWHPAGIFELIARKGGVPADEMFRVFNMGVGMVIVCSPRNAARLLAAVHGAWMLGEVAAQAGPDRVVLD